MIIDHFLEFTKAEGQTLSGDADSDFRFDFEQSDPTTGMDTDRPVAVFNVKEDATGTLKVSLQDSDEEEGTYTDVAVSAEYENPVAGTQIVIPMPMHHKRYLKAHFSGATGGTIRGCITSGVQDNDGFDLPSSLGKNY